MGEAGMGFCRFSGKERGGEMLVMSRKLGERFQIELAPEVGQATVAGELFSNGPIEIIITQISGGTVRIGIQADRRFVILRGELRAK